MVVPEGLQNKVGNLQMFSKLPIFIVNLLATFWRVYIFFAQTLASSSLL